MSAKKNHLGILPAHRIKQLRLAKGMTQKAFSDSLGIVQGYLSGIESGRKIPSHTLLMALCHIHGVREEWLYSGSGEMFLERPGERTGDAGGTTSKTPLLKGLPKGFPHTISADEIVDYIHLPGTPDGCFALKAEGDFMAPTIRDGDLVIFTPGQEMINRSIVLLSNRWGDVIMRRARLTGREVFFSAENTVYAPFHPDADTTIFGTVVCIWRNVKII